MWRRVFTVRPPSWTAFLKSTPFRAQNIKNAPSYNLKLTLRVGTTLAVPNVIYLDLPKTQNGPPVPTSIVKVLQSDDPQQVNWQPTIGDVMHVVKLLLIGGLVWGISGCIIGGVLFKVCSNVGHHVTRWVSIPTSIFSGAVLAVVGLYRGLGHSLIYFINKGLAVHVLNRVVPTRVGDATAIHWDAAVTRVTYSFKVRAEQSGFFVRLMLRSLAKRLESFLLLVKEEDKIKHGTLTDAAINHKLTKLIKHQMRKPLYVVGAVYGAVVAGVAVFVWRS